MFHSTVQSKSALLMCGLVSGALVFGTACSPTKSNGTASTGGTVNLASIASDRALAPQDKAEEMAEIAERMATSPGGFMYAATAARAALIEDPNNKRAKFWAAAVAPIMEMKGILTRIEPLVKKRPAKYAKYQQEVGALKHSQPDKALTRFLFSGPADITTEREAQEVIARVVVRIDELRKLAKEMKNDELTITVSNESFRGSSLDQVMQECQIEALGHGAYKLCDQRNAFERKLNRADFEEIIATAAGYQTYLTVLNAYDLDGVYTKSGQLERITRPIDAMPILLSSPNFGELRKTHGLGLLPDAAKDALVGAHYAIEMQADLCAKGPNQKNRPGYVFEQGFCIEQPDALERVLSTIQVALSGFPTQISVGSDDKPASITFDMRKFFSEPVQDLHTQLPTANACGEIVSIGDGKWNGAFPTGDLNRVLTSNASSACTPQP